MTASFDDPFLRNIGLLLTYKCTVACPHCIVEAGPHRKEEMSFEEAINWIDQAGAYRNGHILGLALTGGEPFYDLPKLRQISEYAQRKGFIVTVVTNGYWAATKDDALRVLEDLPAIKMISLSTDVYHQKAIPLENIKNGIWAANKTGRLHNVAVCTDNQENMQFKQIMEELRGVDEEKNVRVAITFPVGRAQKYESHLTHKMIEEPSIGACNSANSPVIFPNGNVIACIGPVFSLTSQNPLFLGNVREESLQSILDRAEVNPLLHVVRVWGPQKLVALLKEHGYGELLPKEYIENCICDGCYKLLSDKRIASALQDLLKSKEILRIIAYARVFYFSEDRMVTQLKLNKVRQRTR